MTIELDSTLAQAEVLFLSFSQIVADIDRRKNERENPKLPTAGSHLRNRASNRSTKGITPNFAAVQISEELRELLSTNTSKDQEA